MLNYLSFATLLISFLWSPLLSAKNVCSITFNSSDERDAFKLRLEPQGFVHHELLPEDSDPRNKDANWHKDVCASGLQCDVLVISGHFGGLFFGEQKSSILKLADLERWACERSCPGILESPKEVFLMGCNTLAGKQPDKRTPDGYLNILASDGFPLNEAERVVVSRYSKEGFSMVERMAIAFPMAEKVYGFDSTGPLGASAGPKISSYLRNIGDYNKHLDKLDGSKSNRALERAFSGHSIRTLQPSVELSPDKRRLSCQVRFGSPQERVQAFREILRTNRSKEFLDHLRDYPPVGEEFKWALQEEIRKKPQIKHELEQNLNSSFKHHQDLPSITAGLTYLQESLGLKDMRESQQSIYEIMSHQVMKQKVDLLSAEQMCSLAKQNPSIPFSVHWLDKESLRNSEYLPYMLSCFQHWDPYVSQWVKNLRLEKLPPNSRREYLRALKGRWQADEIETFNTLASRFSREDPNDAYELYASAHNIIKPHPSTFEKDASTWACLEPSLRSGDNQTGADWNCITDPNKVPTLGLCLQVAARNHDANNADDMRWACWDRLKNTGMLRSECLRLASSMVIEGNQIKANWNCMNMKKAGKHLSNLPAPRRISNDSSLNNSH